MAMNHLDECIDTFEQAKEALEGIEYRLGQSLDIRKDIRRTLIERNQRGELRETDLVRDWHEALSSYTDWVENEDEDGDASVDDPLTDDPAPADEETDEKAAQAAFALLCHGNRLSLYSGGPGCRSTLFSSDT